MTFGFALVNTRADRAEACDFGGRDADMSHAQSLQSLAGSRGDIDLYQAQHDGRSQQQHQHQQRQQLNNNHLHRPTDHRSASPAQRKAVPASLAQIQVPSFSAFRSQLPNTQRPGYHTAYQPTRASFSRSEKASPRLADPTTRPVSVDSPQLLQPHQFGSSAIPPSWTPAVESPPEDR